MTGGKDMYTLESLFGMNGRPIVVCGGSSGLGREIALALADLGAQVAIVGRSPKKVEKVLGELKEKREDSLGFAADVTDEASIREAYTKINEGFGKIDGLVNTAGINIIESLENISMSDFDKVIDTNFRGMVVSCKVAGEFMLPRGFGAVVNISSQSTRRGKSNYTAYAASKAAIDGFTRALAVEWTKQGVNVNSIAPGLIITDINRADYEKYPQSLVERVSSIPHGRAGEPSDLIAPVVALLSPSCSHIVGHTLFVDGGITIGDTFVLRKPPKD